MRTLRDAAFQQKHCACGWISGKIVKIWTRYTMRHGPNHWSRLSSGHMFVKYFFQYPDRILWQLRRWYSEICIQPMSGSSFSFQLNVYSHHFTQKTLQIESAFTIYFSNIIVFYSIIRDRPQMHLLFHAVWRWSAVLSVLIIVNRTEFVDIPGFQVNQVTQSSRESAAFSCPVDFATK